jgi:hypothetical protein
VPHHRLQGDFPSFFVDQYAHWLDLRTGIIEFRLLSTLWEANVRLNWCLRGLPSDRPLLQQDSTSALLVDIHSSVFQSVNRCLGVLEHANFLVVKLKNGKLYAELPRFKLSFFMNEEGQLESMNLRGMVIDGDQSAGTLFGLENQLILRAKDATTHNLPRSRRVLVPEGTAQLSQGPPVDHPHITLGISSSIDRVAYFEYTVDHDLGRLTGNVSPRSHLYKCYLHALTSGALPDPLTGRTGTEESLFGLKSSRAFSFQRLEQKDFQVLGAITALTPTRAFYPEHLQVMQTVT